MNRGRHLSLETFDNQSMDANQGHSASAGDLVYSSRKRARLMSEDAYDSQHLGGQVGESIDRYSPNTLSRWINQDLAMRSLEGQLQQTKPLETMNANNHVSRYVPNVASNGVSSVTSLSLNTINAGANETNIQNRFSFDWDEHVLDE